MNELPSHVALSGPPTPAREGGPVAPESAPVPAWPLRGLRLLGGALPTVLALGVAAALIHVGHRTGWTMPKFSALTGHAAQPDDWCSEHSVPDSLCVECRKECLPPGKEYGWCRQHGIPECPWCHPEVAELPSVPDVSSEDADRAQRALDFAPRLGNNSKCKLQQRRIQFTSPEAVTRLGIEVAPVTRAAVVESIVANGEIIFDQTAVAHLSARLPGTVWRVYKREGDPVQRGEVLALVEAVEVGKTKAEFQQALVHRDLMMQNLAALQGASGSIPERSLQEAEAAIEEARIRLLTAQQALVNLGMPVDLDTLKGLRPAEVAERLRVLGLPPALIGQFDPSLVSANLIAVTAPLNGVVVERQVTASERVDATKVMFVIADVRRLWLMLNVGLEDARRLRPGLSVHFLHEGHAAEDTGTVAWISPAVEEKSRTVQVRVDLPNPDGRHRARTFGAAQVVLRAEPQAVVVPSEAIHWEGDCNVVFVRDRHFEDKDSPKVFHVRKVRPGAKDGPNTEIMAGVLPGELVATSGSGILRSELLKNSLGAG